MQTRRRSWAAGLRVALCAGAMAMVLRADLVHAASHHIVARDIFPSAAVPNISIEIPPEGLRELRRTGGGRRAQSKGEALAVVRAGELSYSNVAVQLKGFTTYRSIDSQPSLTLDFNKHVLRQSFHGLTKLSLNNSLQDPTRLHEKLARELFAAAGVPVPRADFALVTLNGRALGLYVLAEGFDKAFLKQHFKRADGVLYEGGALQDLDQSLQVKSGRRPLPDTAVEKLVQAAREPDAAKRLQELETLVDLDRFLTMVAVESLLCHSDSYSMNRNNYRMYHDPDSGRFVFMPHGMDRVLGTHRSPLDLGVVPPALGLVAQAVLSTERGRARYLQCAGTLFTNLFRSEALCRRVQEVDAKILPFKTDDAHASFIEPRMGRGPADDARDLCQRIARRTKELELQFAHPDDFLTPAPRARFDSNGVAVVEQWRPLRKPDQPAIRCTPAVRDGSEVWHIRKTGESEILVWRSKVTLETGRYRLQGRLRCSDSSGHSNRVNVFLVTHSASRYAIDQRRIEPGQINVSFQVNAPRWSDEVEIRCEARSSSPELWFDASSLRLIREPNAGPASSRRSSP